MVRLHPARLLGSPRALLAVLLLSTMLLLPVAARLRLEGNIIDLLPRSSAAARAFASFSHSLVEGQELVILVTCDDPQRLLRFADAYATALSRLPAARQVSYRVSQKSVGYLRDHLLLLLNDDEIAELGRRLQPGALREQVHRLRGLLTLPGGGAMAPLLLADPLELVPLVSSRLSSGLPVDAQSGYFRTADGRALLIKVRPGFDPMDWRHDQDLIGAASALATSLGGQVATSTTIPTGPLPTVAFTGSYAFPPYYKKWLHEDMTLSTTISAVSVLLLFALFFRALRILPVVMIPLGVAGVWTAAAAELLFHRINAVSVAFGTILVAIGIDLPIQLYNRLREELLQRPSDLGRAVRTTIDTLAGPAVMATLGPAAVFFCCALSAYRGLNELGILAGLGLCLNCFAMLTLFPALLLCLPVPLWLGPRTAAADRRRALRSGSSGLLALLGRVCARRPKLVLLCCGVLLLFALPFALRLRFDRQLFDLEPRDMPPHAAQAEIARRFGDRQRLLVAVVEDADQQQALWRADLWLREAERLRQAGLLRGYEALGTLVPSQRTQDERRQQLRRLGLPQAAQRLEEVLSQEGFDPQSFAGFLDQLRQEPPPLSLSELNRTELSFLVRSHLAELPPSEGRSGWLAAVYLFAPQDRPLGPVLSALSRVAQGEAGGTLTGPVVLENELLSIVQKDTLKVTAASVAAVALLLLLYYRRRRPIAAVLLPLSLAWVLFAAAMSAFGLRLNLYNLLSIPLCIGYGIDDHIFLVHRYEAMPPARRDPVWVLSTTGRAIVLTTLSTMVGFAGLLPAHFEGLRLLGLSGALAVLLCLLAAFAVLPALLVLLWPPRADAAVSGQDGQAAVAHPDQAQGQVQGGG